MQQTSLFEEDRLESFSHLDRDELLSSLKRLIELYAAGVFGDIEHEVHPNLERNSAENYLYFTLAPALNFQRKSESLWRSALLTFSDPDTKFVFQPENVIFGEERFRSALVKHKLALQPNKHTSIWFTLCTTLHNDYDNDPRNLLLSCNNDVVQVLALLQKEKKKFPYLSGPKLSNYWLYMLAYFTDIKLNNQQEISIIPDVHVMRATKYLGLVNQTESEDREIIASRWKEFLSGTGIAPSDLHGPLWRWSRANFEPAIS